MARLRNAPATQNAPPADSSRQALKDRTNTARTKAPVYENDGDTEGLIKDARPRRGRAKKATQNEDEYVMVGGLGNRDSDNLVTQSEAPTPTDELAKDGGPLSPAKEPIKRSQRGAKPSLQNRAPEKATNVAKTRLQAPAHKTVSSRKSRDLPDDEIVVSSSEAITKPRVARRPNKSNTERSDYSLTPSPPPPQGMSSIKRSSLAQSRSALRISGTPAVESSILALKNFKRRPRQGSMLQMVQQRTASARPSVLNTNTIAHADGLDIESAASDDEEAFAPDAEGTPLLKKGTKQVAGGGKSTTTQTSASNAAIKAAQSRKRKSDEIDNSMSALDALRAKRQKQSQDHQDPSTTSRQTAAVCRSSSVSRRTPPPALTSDVQVINSSSSTPPSDPPSPGPEYDSEDPDAVVPSTEKEQSYANTHAPVVDLEDQDDVPNGTMADPVSSSPVHSSPPPQATQQTDIMADPRTQISPPRPKTRDKKSEKKSKPLDTAALQAMLPKRRKPLQPRHRQSEYDFESQSEPEDGPIDLSHLSDDEDELSGSARRKTKPAAKAKPRNSTAAKPRKSKAAPARKSTAQTKTRKSKAAKGPSKTYGRGTTSDKENEDAFEDVDNDESILPETSISMYEATRSTELEALRKKFAALDEEEMEFENVEVEEGRSSSQLWR